MRKVVAGGKRFPIAGYEEHLISVKLLGPVADMPVGTRWLQFVQAGDLRITTYRDANFRLVGEPVVFVRVS